MRARWRIKVLSGEHDRSEFSCGASVLDRYLRTQAGQDARRRVAATFVLLPEGRQSVVGYYTLSALSIRLHDLPPATAKKLPRYPHVPATLLGRLAVDSRYHGQGLGELLLTDALERSYRHSGEIASTAVVVDALDDRARAFYERYGFVVFPEHRNRLFLPMATIARAFAG